MLVAGQGGPTTHPAGLGGGKGGTVQSVKTRWSTAAGLGSGPCTVLIQGKGFHSLLGRARCSLPVLKKTKKL